jgi:DNA-directed RNA polymerase specialized sigma24 family protein
LEKRKPARVLAPDVYKAVREKLDEVFREMRRKLVRFAFFKLGNQADAEDAVQDGCVNMLWNPSKGCSSTPWKTGATT